MGVLSMARHWVDAQVRARERQQEVETLLIEILPWLHSLPRALTASSVS
jgi:hypothetical protein